MAKNYDKIKCDKSLVMLCSNELYGDAEKR